MDSIRIQTALVSVSDKTHLEPLTRRLHTLGVRLYSTGGTHRALQDWGIPAQTVESLTEFPEMMDGRLKTLHPHVFAGILGRRNHPQDTAGLESRGLPWIDLVVVNLYDFASALDKPLAEQVEKVDIGGPSLLRAAAKNHAWVTVLSHPDDYAAFSKLLEAPGPHIPYAYRQQQAALTFSRTAHYDRLIADQWSPPNTVNEFPQSLAFDSPMPLRYGENPHQKAIWSGEQKAWSVLQGKELSYNNLADCEAAYRLVQEFSEPAVAIIKHNTPCGAASHKAPLSTLFQQALEADPQSAFGGIVACNQSVDEATAKHLSELFLEVVLAPDFSAKALQVLGAKKNLRLVQVPNNLAAHFEVRAALGGWLVQQSDSPSQDGTVWRTVTEKQVPDEAQSDLRFAWKVAKHLRSNAIAIAKQGITLGLGGGQTSRVEAVTLALARCQKRTQGAVLASDAFFPFRDGVDSLKGTGIVAVIQPGGSRRDAEVIEACNEAGIAMVFTGQRHFKH